MRWRPYMVVLGLVVAGVWTGGLVWYENLPRRAVDDVYEVQDEPLRRVGYSPSRRRDNLQEMGMDPQLADETAEYIKRLASNRDRFEKQLNEQSVDVGAAFCIEGSRLPQPYAALEFLVSEEAGERVVVDGFRLFSFSSEAWFGDGSRVGAVYDSLEARKDRRPDATLMGVAAILTQRELEAIERRGPWSSNAFLGGTFDTVARDAPALRQKIIEYFALMHTLSEIANQPDGICDPELL